MFVILAFIEMRVYQCRRTPVTRLSGASQVSKTRKSVQSGFTLIEIMVVVIIIGILVAMVAPNVLGKIDQAQVTRVHSDLKAVENALKFYRLDNFAYPTSEQGLEALVTRPNDPNLRNWNSQGYLPRIPEDPWQRPYLYMNPGQNGEIDIYTLGRDGQPGGEGVDADIGNWDLQ